MTALISIGHARGAGWVSSGWNKMSRQNCRLPEFCGGNLHFPIRRNAG
jgi:uncharacterized membrane protein